MNNPVIVLLLSLSITVIIVFIAIFVAYYNQKQNQQKLRLQEKEVELQQRLLENSLNVQEVERRRIAQDLHDEVGALLSATKMTLNALGKQVTEQPSAYTAFLNSKKMVEESIMNVRRISKDLIPSTLENFGLVAALEDFLNKVKSATGYKINFQSNILDENRLSTHIELMLYRIVQELTNNAIKHSDATEYEININQEPTLIKLVFYDNGKGFDKEKQSQDVTSGLGLRNIESRVKVLNGDLKIVSNETIGTRFTILIPLYYEKN